MKKNRFLLLILALLAFGQMAWAQAGIGNVPAEVRAEDATITELGHATLTVEMKIVTDSLTRRTDTLFATKNIEWHTEPGTAKRRNAEQERSGGSGFYNEGSNWWLDIYWYNYTYPSINANGEPVILSSMACMPDEDCDYVNNVIIGCHVTITSNKECPSSYTDEGSATTDVSLLMNHAGSGLVFHTEQSDGAYYNLVILPDYEGYGLTRSHAHPYLYQELTARQVVDAVRYGIALYNNSSIIEEIHHPFRQGWRSICVGYSQGGSVAMATQRFIEQNGLTDELQLAGSVCGDGPYDPVATLLYYVNQYQEHKSMSMPVVLPLILKGMCDWNPYMKNHQVSDYLSDDFLATGVLDWLTQKEKTTDDITKAWIQHYFDTEHVVPNLQPQTGYSLRLDLEYVLKYVGLDYFTTLYDFYYYDNTYTSEAGVPLPSKRGLMEDLHFALASNNLTKGWTPRHAMFLYHSKDDSVVPEDNRESAGNSFGEWVIKVRSGLIAQYDHVGTGTQFYLGTAEFEAIRHLSDAKVHQTIQDAKNLKTAFSTAPGLLDDWDNPPVINSNIVKGTVSLNGTNIPAEYVIKDGNAHLGTGNNACISQYSVGNVVVPATITVNNTTYPVTEVSALAFRLCSQITEVTLPVNVTRIGNFAFNGCHELTKVDLPSTLASIGTGAFVDLPNLVKIDCHATTPPTWEYNDVFKFHSGGIGDSGTYEYTIALCVPAESIETYQNTLFSNSAIGWTTPDGWGHFSVILDTFEENAEDYAVYKDGVLTFYYDANKNYRDGVKYDIIKENNVYQPWYEDGNREFITTVVFHPSFSFFHPTYMSYWFYYCTELKTIIGWEYLQTDQVSYMNSLFQGCEKLTDEALDLSNFNTSNVVSMDRMFTSCQGLVRPNVSFLDTKSCRDFDYMFWDCHNIDSLDLSSFVVIDHGINSYNYMFNNCHSLKYLNISSLKLRNGIGYQKMLKVSWQLKTLVLPSSMVSTSSQYTDNPLYDPSYHEYVCCFDDDFLLLEDVYFYGYDPFSSWATNETCFKPNKATRFHVLANRLDAWIAAYPNANVTFVGDLGTEANPIPIYSASDWDNLNNLTQHDQTIYAKLMNDLTVYSTVGSNDHPFTGVFDGNGNMLTAFLEFNATENPIEVAAPFRAIRNATIKNLVMDGTIVASGQRYVAGGLVGLCRADGTNTVQNYITNCHVTNTITGNIMFLSGIIGFTANIGGNINEDSDHIHNTITGCLFDGQLISTSTQSVAGAISCYFQQINNHVVTDCVESGKEYQVTNGFMFCGLASGGGQHTPTTNCYYTFNASVNGHEMEVGDTDTKKAHSITTQTEGVGLGFGLPTTTYDVSGLEFFKENSTNGNVGVRFYDYYFAGEGDQNIVTIWAPGYEFSESQVSITGDAGHSAQSTNIFNITMGTSDVVINIEDMTFTTVVLYDNSSTNNMTLEDHIGETYDVEIEDHVIYASPRWNTLCLPFDLPSLTGTPLEGATLKVIDTITFENKVAVYHFKDTTAITANKPYLVKKSNATAYMTFHDVTIQRSLPPGMKGRVGETFSKGFSFMGNYNFKSGGELGPKQNYRALYLDANNQLQVADNSTTLPAFNAFFEILGMPLDTVAAVVLDIPGEDNIFTVLDDTFTNIDNIFYSDGGWNTASKWATAAVPSSSDKVLIEGHATIPAGITANVDEIAIDAGSITIEDGGQLMHNNAGVTAKVQKNVAKHTTDGGWYFVASPFAVTLNYQNVTNLVTDAYDFYYYDEQNHYWRNHKSHIVGGVEQNQDPLFNLAPDKGFLYANGMDTITYLEFDGTTQGIGLNYGTSKTIQLEYHATTASGKDNPLAGWNLVGNPFTYAAGVDRPYYTVDENGAAIANTTTTAYVPPCTGILVKLQEYEYEQGDNEVTFSHPTEGAAPSNGNLNIAVVQAKERGASTVVDNAIVSFDEGNELPKYYFMQQNANLYIPQSGEEYAIVFSEGQGEMPINFKATENGTYTISVNPEDVEMHYLHLIDNLTGAEVDLLQQPEYTFTAKTTDYASRFKLVFSANSEDGPSTGSGAFAFVSNGNIFVNGEGTLQVIDVTGRIIVSDGGRTRCVPTSRMTPGVYVLRLINGDDVKTQKMVIQ